jgi:3-methyladenine DNA glycosylase AlkD
MGSSKKCREISEHLFELQDTEYRDFQSKLIPTVDAKCFIGVRTPDLRKYASALAKQEDITVFLNSLPHKYFDENQLHAFILSEDKDFERCLSRVSVFLPYVDNWATCDQMSPKVFKKHRAELLPVIERWLHGGHAYTVRFAIGMLMEHFLDGDFDPRYLAWVSAVRSGEYYVNMMVAWYFATALAKQYEAAFPYIRDRRLPAWTHNKAIQKAAESYRVPPEHKAALKACKAMIDKAAKSG